MAKKLTQESDSKNHYVTPQELNFNICMCIYLQLAKKTLVVLKKLSIFNRGVKNVQRDA